MATPRKPAAKKTTPAKGVKTQTPPKRQSAGWARAQGRATAARNPGYPQYG